MRTLAANRLLYSGYVLRTDGSQNYIDCGTMRNFGQNAGSGVYAKCNFSVPSGYAKQGFLYAIVDESGQQFSIELNLQNSVNQVSFLWRDAVGNLIDYKYHGTNINNGSIHTLIASGNPAGTATLTLDGTIVTPGTTVSAQTLTTFNNYTDDLVLGVDGDVNIGPTLFGSITFYNFYLGNTSGSFIGEYNFTEGSGTTTADSSGNGNTGTLLGSPPPIWLYGLNPGHRTILATNRQLAINRQLHA